MHIPSMDDQPYTTPEEDPFNIRPLLQPCRKRSSMLNKWIHDQQQAPNSTDDEIQDLTSESSSPFQSGMRSHPYLAYPDLGTAASPNVSAVTLNSFDLVEDDDIPFDIVPDTPSATPSSTFQRRFGTPTSLKNLHISFRSNSQSPTTPSRMSFLPLGSRFASGSGKSPSKQHARSSSLSTLDSASPATPKTSSSTKWRPSVLGHFSSSQVSMDPSEALYAPPRPSMSSSHTATSTATSITSPTITDQEVPVTPTKIFGLRSKRLSQGNLLQSPSFASISERSDIGSCRLKTDSAKTGSVRLPFAPKPVSQMTNSNVYHDDDEEGMVPVQSSKSNRPEMAFSSSGKSGTIPRVALSALSTRNQKKKKLVINGVAPHDTRKFDGVKRWCESFGEVTHIVRMPNGELVVHFRSADVADTVCRLRAQVYIAGVGSVNLSWYTGKR